MENMETLEKRDKNSQNEEEEAAVWSFSTALLALVAAFGLSMLLSQNIYLLLPHLPEAVYLFLGALVQCALFIALPYTIADSEAKGRGFARLGLCGPPGLRIFGRALVWGLGCYILTVCINVIVVTFFVREPQMQEILQSLSAAPLPWQQILLVFAIVVLAPLGEEILFRGFLYRACAARFGPFWGMALSGLLFGAAHLEWQVFPAFAVLGMVLAHLYRKSGNLWLCIATHAVFNAIGVVLLFSSQYF